MAPVWVDSLAEQQQPLQAPKHPTLPLRTNCAPLWPWSGYLTSLNFNFPTADMTNNSLNFMRILCGPFSVNNVLKIGPGAQSGLIHVPLHGSRAQAAPPPPPTEAGTVQMWWLGKPVHFRSSIWWFGTMHRTKWSKLRVSTLSQNLSYTGMLAFCILF